MQVKIVGVTWSELRGFGGVGFIHFPRRPGRQLVHLTPFFTQAQFLPKPDLLQRQQLRVEFNAIFVLVGPSRARKAP